MWHSNILRAEQEIPKDELKLEENEDFLITATFDENSVVIHSYEWDETFGDWLEGSSCSHSKDKILKIANKLNLEVK